MHESFDKPEEPREGKEFQDSRFHDDDEDVPVDDVLPRKTRVPDRRRPNRKPPLRRYDYDD
jgi:hypothetical protein